MAVNKIKAALDELRNVDPLLLESEEKYRNILETLFDGVHLVDFPSMRSLYVNPPLAFL